MCSHIILLILLNTITTILLVLNEPTFAVVVDNTLLRDNCDLIRCRTPLEHCEPDKYIVYKDPDYNQCCNSCINYSLLDEDCSETQCSPVLICQYGQAKNIKCAYAWDSYDGTTQNCAFAEEDCIKYKSCQKGYFLRKGGSTDQCCDQCYPYSKLGQYCDNKQRCLYGLKCDNQSKTCKSQRCEDISCKKIKQCSNGTYYLERDGLKRCCAKCQPYAQEGDSCDYEEQLCGEQLYCDWSNRTCVKSPYYPCALVDCAPIPPCLDGTIVPAGPYNCCPYCQIGKNYREYCDNANKCRFPFVCERNRCEQKDCPS